MKNVGSADKVIRIVLGLALLAYAFFGQGPYHWAGLIGLVAIGTALIGWCPLYTLLGVKTCAVKKA